MISSSQFFFSEVRYSHIPTQTTFISLPLEEPQWIGRIKYYVRLESDLGIFPSPSLAQTALKYIYSLHTEIQSATSTSQLLQLQMEVWSERDIDQAFTESTCMVLRKEETILQLWQK